MIIANFGNEKEKYVSGLDQYDYGQVLRIQGLNLPTAVEIHFGLEDTGGTTTTRIGVTKDGVTDVVIPDSMLENGDIDRNYMIYVFVYLSDEKSGETIRRITMKVDARSKPEAFDRPEDAELFREAIKAVNESAARSEESEKQAEGWSHGREDLPERVHDNAKYYSDQAKEDSLKTDADRKEVERLVESVSGIDRQVALVKDYSDKAQTSATNAALSEQAAKESENNASTSETNAKQSEQAVELAKTSIDESKQAVDEIVARFSQSVVVASQTLENEKEAHLQAIANSGAAETKKVTDEGTKQAGAVRTEAEKHLKTMQDATNGIIADRKQINTNKTEVAQLKEDLNDIAPRVDNLEKKTAKYSEQFFENFFAMQRTGKKYTVRFPLWETSQVAVGEKLDDNEGLVMEASTLTEKGRDDYSSIPLFKTYDCNVEMVDGKLRITAMKGDAGYNPKEKDVFVLGMPYYHKAWVQDGFQYYSRSDSPLEGYTLCQEARKTNGMRNFCLYGKYVAGRNSKGVLGSFKDKAPVRNLLSYNGGINEAKKRGTEYCFGCASEYAYIQSTFMLKYADRNWNKLLGGCFAYNEQSAVSVPEENVKRVILTKANAERFIVGSSVSVVDLGAETNKDRSSAKIHNLCDNVKILDIVEVDSNSKALVLDIPSNITTTATTWVTSMHWMSGFSDDILGTDGCPCKMQSQIPSMSYPSVIQGIELAVGGYEVLGNAFMDILTDATHRDAYVCDDSAKLTIDMVTAKKNYKKLPKQMSVTGTAQWCCGTEIHIDLENGMNIITQAGASGSGTSAGYCDGIYFDNAINTQREFLLLGDLWSGGMGGAFCSDGGSGLGDAGLYFLARLSLSVFRGEFA